MPDKSPVRNDDDQPKRAALHLGRNLISLRHARSLTQDALAAASGLPRSTIANLESGEGNPSLAVLVKIAQALNAPIDELIAAPYAKVRKWASREVGSRMRGRGVAERPLVPEPTEELLIVMDFFREPVSISPALRARSGLSLPESAMI